VKAQSAKGAEHKPRTQYRRQRGDRPSPTKWAGGAGLKEGRGAAREALGTLDNKHKCKGSGKRLLSRGCESWCELVVD